MNRFPVQGRSYSESTLIDSAVIILVFNIIFLAAYFFRFSSGPKYETMNSHRVDNTYTFNRNFLLAFSAVHIAGFLFLMQRHGISNLLSTRSEAGLTGSDSLAIATAIRFTSFFSFLFSLMILIERKSTQNALIFLINLCLFLIVNFPLAIPRFYFLGYLIFLLTTFGAIFHRRGRVLFVLGCIAGAGIVLPMLANLTRNNAAEFDLQRYLSTGDFDGLQSVNNAVIYAESAGNTWGQQILSTLLFFIPRSIWPGKSEHTGSVVSEFVNYTYLNISAPIYAELYVDFGWIGILLGALALGYFGKKFDLAATKYWSTDIRIRLWAAFVMGFGVIIFRGAWLAIAGPIASAVLCIFLLGRFGMRKIK